MIKLPLIDAHERERLPVSPGGHVGRMVDYVTWIRPLKGGSLWGILTQRHASSFVRWFDITQVNA
jgi:hypothetical protein